MKYGCSNRCNYSVTGNVEGEKFTLPSLTIPGQTLSLKELLEKYVRGQDVTVFEGVYNDDDIPDNLELMTEIERIDAARNLKDAIDVERERLTVASVLKGAIKAAKEASVIDEKFIEDAKKEVE